MARASKRPDPPPSDDNGPPAVDDREALFHSHMAKIRDGAANVQRAKETVKELQKPLNVVRNIAKNDGFSLKLIDEILADEAKTRADLTAESVQRHWMRSMLGLPAGGQADLLDPLTKTPTLVRDKEYWNWEGYRAGISGDDGRPPQGPTGCPGEFVQDWMDGWHRGQARNVDMLNRGAELESERAAEAARASADAGVDEDADDDDSDRDEDDGEIDQEEVAAQARRLQGGDFMKTGDEPD